MTSLLNMLNRFEQAAVTYETSTKKADREELHAARRAIMEREAELITRVASNADHARLANANHDLMAKALASMREREAELVKALELAEGRIALLLEEFPEESKVSDHPCATGHVLNRVRAALRSSQQNT